jgi:NAD-dependent SIR2 family protein deacetylase
MCSTACGIPDFRGDNGMDKYGWKNAVLGMGVGKVPPTVPLS